MILNFSQEGNEDYDKHLEKFSYIFVDIVALGVVYEESSEVWRLLRSLMESSTALTSTYGALKWIVDKITDKIR